MPITWPVKRRICTELPTNTAPIGTEKGLGMRFWRVNLATSVREVCFITTLLLCIKLDYSVIFEQEYINRWIKRKL